MTSLRILLAAILATAAAGAFAQTTNRPPDPIPPDKYGAPISPMPEQQARPPVEGEDPPGLNHSGVLHPPGTGDHNIKAPPGTGDNLVIPPPDSPHDTQVNPPNPSR